MAAGRYAGTNKHESIMLSLLSSNPMTLLLKCSWGGDGIKAYLLACEKN